MDAPQPLDAAAKANTKQAAKAIYKAPVLGSKKEDLTAEVTKTIQFLKYSFFNCYRFQEERLEELVSLLREAESRGIAVTEAVGLADSSFWLQMIANHMTYLDAHDQPVNMDMVRSASDPEIERVLYEFLPSGFEINDGGQGDVTIDVAAGTVKLEHQENVTETKDSTQEFTL